MPKNSDSNTKWLVRLIVGTIITLAIGYCFNEYYASDSKTTNSTEQNVVSNGNRPGATKVK